MKIKLLLLTLLLVVATTLVQAQQVRVRLNFPVGISIGASGHRPYNGAVWIGPEWQWRGGRYVAVQGYWAKPGRYGAVWVPGHWKYSRRGYRWVPGHWR
jgi:WXXGXW repeat (2 copies)